MEDIKIEHGIPITTTPPPNARKYPFNKMEIGDSFFVPVERNAKRCRVGAAAFSYGRRKGKKFSTRTVFDDDGNTIGHRVWRVE